jgi:hypothetical protein
VNSGLTCHLSTIKPKIDDQLTLNKHLKQDLGSSAKIKLNGALQPSTAPHRLKYFRKSLSSRCSKEKRQLEFSAVFEEFGSGGET